MFASMPKEPQDKQVSCGNQTLLGHPFLGLVIEIHLEFSHVFTKLRGKASPTRATPPDAS